MRLPLVLISCGFSQILLVTKVALESRLLCWIMDHHVGMELEGAFEHFVAVRNFAGEDFSSVVNERVTSQIVISNKD